MTTSRRKQWWRFVYTRTEFATYLASPGVSLVVRDKLYNDMGDQPVTHMRIGRVRIAWSHGG